MSPMISLKQSQCAGCPPHVNRAWDNSSRTRKWVTENHPFLRHLKGPKQDIPYDSLCTIWASHLLSHVQARPRADWTPPRSSPTEFVWLHHRSHLRVSRLPCPTTRADSVLKSSRVKWLLCVRPQHADAPTWVTTAATPLVTHLTVTTSAGITDVSRMKHKSAIHQLPPAGKLHQQSLVATNVCTTNSCRLLLNERVRKQRYVVATGPDLCVFPHKHLPGRRERTEYTLYITTETTIPTYGWISQSLNLELLHMEVHGSRCPVTHN